MSDPKAGETWKHYNGNDYKIIMITNEHTQRPDEYPVTVVYQNINNGTIWSRPLKDWHRSMSEHNIT